MGLVLTNVLVALALLIIAAILVARPDRKSPLPIPRALEAAPPTRFISPRVRRNVEKRRKLAAEAQAQTDAAVAIRVGRRTRADIRNEILGREEMKRACLSMLDAAAIEHPAGHSKHIARYILRSQSGERIEMMFERGEKSRANLWLACAHAASLVGCDIEIRTYPASDLYRVAEPGETPSYGRHAGLKQMRALANADLVRFTFEGTAELERILERLAAL